MSASHVAGFVVSIGIAVFFGISLFHNGTNGQGKMVCLLIGFMAAYFAVLNGARLLGLK